MGDNQSFFCAGQRAALVRDGHSAGEYAKIFMVNGAEAAHAWHIGFFDGCYWRE